MALKERKIASLLGKRGAKGGGVSNHNSDNRGSSPWCTDNGEGSLEKRRDAAFSSAVPPEEGGHLSGVSTWSLKDAAGKTEQDPGRTLSEVGSTGCLVCGQLSGEVDVACDRSSLPPTNGLSMM